MQEKHLLRWLLAFVKQEKLKVACAVCLGIISNLAVIAIPILGVQALLQLTAGLSVKPGQTLLLMVLCGVVRGVARYLEQYLNHDIAFSLLAVIRNEIFAAVRRLGPAKLSGKHSGDLITAITSDVEALEVFFAHTISPVLIAIGTTTATVSWLFCHSGQLALLLLTGQLLVGVLIPLLGYRQSRALGDDYQEAFVQLNQQVMENVASLQDVAQYELAEARLQQLRTAGEELNQQYRRRLQQESPLKIYSEAVLLATAVGVFWLGIQLQLPAATVLLGTVLSLSSFGSVLALSGLGSALLTVFASGRRLYGLTQEQPPVTFSGATVLAAADFSDNTFEQVSFGYEQRPAVLQELSLAVSQGRRVGIGGESGSGKSTLLKLLMRYWDPQEGRISFNRDTDVKDLTEASLHQIEGVMEQQTFIFETTVAANIALGKKQATLAEITAAAEKAALHDWIMTLPQGYETPIGGQQRQVSDGERQRLGLARLFLQDAPYLLLDEPTSNLDYLNEQAILQTLAAGLSAKTVLLISHRETTLALADECYELTDGQLSKR